MRSFEGTEKNVIFSKKFLIKVTTAQKLIKLGFSPKYIFVLKSENSVTTDSPGKYLKCLRERT